MWRGFGRQQNGGFADSATSARVVGASASLDAVVRSVLLASVGCSSAVHEGCFVWQVLWFLGNKKRAALLPNALQGALWRRLGVAV
ncbi:hypothetical protein CTM45_10275 [Prevotella intermedia]|nr:hypothetical protein CTM45_10275 [Prevotella intermedia]